MIVVVCYIVCIDILDNEVKNDWIFKKIDYLKDSPTLKLNDRINFLKGQGKDIINLTVGEPNYYEPIVSSEAAISAIQKHFTHYTNSSGILSLRKNICEKLSKENNLNYSPQQITVSMTWYN